ncbi:MAG: class I SAM-dependent methyltransferase [Patescibacteria group bacterium]
MTQVDKKAYHLSTYSTADRWVSYYHQLRLATACAPRNILEIGVGDKVFGSYIKENTNIAYVGADYDATVSPDVIADILKLPFKDEEFDVVCVFEVLEHLPFGQFEKALAELSRVSVKHVLISLPHFGPPVKLSFKIPFLPEVKLAWKLPWPKKHVFNGQHYWEIGKKGYSIDMLRSVFRKHFVLKQDFVPFENQYHHFFVLEKKP